MCSRKLKRQEFITALVASQWSFIFTANLARQWQCGNNLSLKVETFIHSHHLAVGTCLCTDYKTNCTFRLLRKTGQRYVLTVLTTALWIIQVSALSNRESRKYDSILMSTFFLFRFPPLFWTIWEQICRSNSAFKGDILEIVQRNSETKLFDHSKWITEIGLVMKMQVRQHFEVKL